MTHPRLLPADKIADIEQSLSNVTKAQYYLVDDASGLHVVWQVEPFAPICTMRWSDGLRKDVTERIQADAEMIANSYVNLTALLSHAAAQDGEIVRLKSELTVARETNTKLNRRCQILEKIETNPQLVATFELLCAIQSARMWKRRLQNLYVTERKSIIKYFKDAAESELATLRERVAALEGESAERLKLLDRFCRISHISNHEKFSEAYIEVMGKAVIHIVKSRSAAAALGPQTSEKETANE